jgi:tetratricopeptide (TPR) repeat protein
MSPDELRQSRFQRLQKIEHSGLPALTILEARRFLSDFPNYGPAWHVLGGALIDLARYDEAESALTRAIELCPGSIRSIPLNRMGELFKCKGDYTRAAQWYRKAIKAAPDDNAGLIYLGCVQAVQGRLREAEKTHRRATMCAEGCIDEAFLNLGFVLRAQERFPEAAECFREAIRLDPKYREAKKALTDVQRCIGLCEKPL